MTRPPKRGQGTSYYCGTLHETLDSLAAPPFLNETGARLNETISVRMKDIHTDSKGKVTVTVTGKGGYIRTLYLTPVLTRKLKV